MSKTIKFAAIGECMIELSHDTPTQLQLGFAGDSYNLACYLARYQQQVPVTVDYITAIGQDPYSAAMLATWQGEGIGISHVRRIKGKLPGLYFIKTDDQGERRFFYYRSESAAKQLFSGEAGERSASSFLSFDALFLSGISLAILETEGLACLLPALKKFAKQGGMLIFDGNYRSRLWSSAEQAREVFNKVLTWTSIALPTFSDEQKLYQDADERACAERMRALGVKEVVVKAGEKGCYVLSNEADKWVAAETVSQIVDTTAAGDSFNAGYIAGRIKGLSPVEAARCGHRLASIVISHRGAIIDKSLQPVISA